jgi:predicted metal-dependent phosphotriesterase family hydrolase
MRTITRRKLLKFFGISAAASAFPFLSFGQTRAFPEGAVIRTMLRDYAPEELAGGATLFHEHLSVAPDFMDKFRAANAAVQAQNGTGPATAPNAAPAGNNPPAAPRPPSIGPTTDLDAMVADINKARAAGVACIVDAGHPDMGRDIEFARKVAMQSGMPIVACAGFYSQPYYPASIATMSEDDIVQAILEQIDANPAGALGEIGSWDEMTKDERKVFRAVGRVNVATNLPIITHTGIPGKAAIEQLNILEDVGVNPASVVIGHLGNLVDPNVYVHKNICRRGAFVGFDRQGGNGDAQQVPMVMALIEAGFADNLLFSADAFGGYEKTLTAFLPKLKDAGADEEVLHRIMVDNPRRFLAFVPKR